MDLELGVNIGDLEGVAMRNVPPSPANYAQRAGRTGRETRTGIIAGFARGTPHDGYFFDHPDEVISGAILAVLEHERKRTSGENEQTVAWEHLRRSRRVPRGHLRSIDTGLNLFTLEPGRPRDRGHD